MLNRIKMGFLPIFSSPKPFSKEIYRFFRKSDFYYICEFFENGSKIGKIDWNRAQNNTNTKLRSPEPRTSKNMEILKICLKIFSQKYEKIFIKRKEAENFFGNSGILKEHLCKFLANSQPLFKNTSLVSTSNPFSSCC